MPNDKRFDDEWLVRAVLSIPSVTEPVIEKYRREKGRCLANELINDKVCTLHELEQAVAKTHRCVEIPEDVSTIDPMALSMVPEKICRARRLLPIRLTEGGIDLAVANPLDVDGIADVEVISGRKVTLFYCSEPRLQALMDNHFTEESVIHHLLNKIAPSADADDLEVLLEKHLPTTDTTEANKVTAPVVKLVNTLLRQAILMRASDIHVEQKEGQTEIRFRIDGLLKNIMTIPKQVGKGPLVSRIKIMSNLDVANRLRPQDGRAKIRFAGREIGLRVSILPTDYGEKVVIRLLDQSSAEVPLATLGFGSNNLARLEALMQSGQGMIIVTGPTGSGKTTTLYAMLNFLKSEVTNITTVEDPIEYHLPGINQVQVNEKQGLTFANVLRSVLRQDPDIILVGEIRDGETAAVAFQAAMTGHLVFATLHTNDTLSSIPRLTDMGIESYKIAPSLLAVTAQRLVRRLCPDCRKEISLEKRDALMMELLAKHGFPTRYFVPEGCQKCGFSGYAGRLSLLELLVVGRRLREKIAKGADEAVLRETAEQEKSLTPILIDALWHLSEGHTTPEEILPHLGLHNTRPRATAQTRDGAPRVLVADDDPSIRLILRGALESKGYHVEEAHDGGEALKALADRPFDLLLLDLTMPQVSGHEVVRILREERGLFQMPIIVISGDQEESSQEKALTLGADDYILKPFKPSIVLSRVHAAIRRTQ